MPDDTAKRPETKEEPGERPARFRTFADFTYDWEYWLDPKGHLVYVSPSCERVSGYRPDEYYANPQLMKEIIHPDDRPRFIQHLHDKDLQTRTFSLEFRILTRDGRERWLEHRCQPITDSDRNYLGERATNRDITDRKRMEEKLRASGRRLRREVRRRKTAQDELHEVYSSLNRCQENERLAISRELHDEIGQNLTALNITLTRAARSSPEKAGPLIEQAKSLVTELNAQVHDLLANVRRPVVERMGLLPGLLAHFDRYESLTGVKVEFSHRGPDAALPAETAAAASHILQEALTNVARHAGVRKVRVRLQVTDRKLSVLVSDRGAGFDPVAMAEKTTTGLSGMNERAAAAGGRLKISSSPGAGTSVLLELPLDGTTTGGEGR